MRISSLAAATLISSAGAAPLQERNWLEVDALAAQGVFNLGLYVALHGYPNPKKCTLANVAVRKEWGSLSSQEKKNYIAAVQCISKKAPKTPAALAPGVKNRYDDFVAAHMNQTLSIHGTGNFLVWHRYFTWAYEQALRNECGYTGYQPYFSWPKWADDPANSPIFDGSATSMSGNGEFKAHNATCIPSNDLCQISLPPGHGGGCVKTGPFKDWSVNLGPVAPALSDVPSNPGPGFGLGYNPRCLRRDISKAASQGWTKDSDVSDLIKNNDDPYWFITNLQGNFPAGYLGVHTAGHFIIGGDPGGDLFTSPGDPAFFLHHAMIDRVYWIWQNLDIKNRQNSGFEATITINNSPPSRNATLADTFDLGINAPTTTIGDTVNTLDGPFCYIYA
ncbi:Di-copper centre-containing protein [Lindgomyces ingoldianus]|uniref:Di-copper centre-containing protein n=1 Tax=Lindgomyces ingoldianus TaxID=673940 RepID=A0ACB6QQH8_9PLEO|nr:Di-copper centre-containing protein [Lindgomyces ingoldianus]KAF2469140.1 Di-copper centre-containing protein [Lindgomyces ingoldianus]